MFDKFTRGGVFPYLLQVHVTADASTNHWFRDLQQKRLSVAHKQAREVGSPEEPGEKKEKSGFFLPVATTRHSSSSGLLHDS